MKYNGRKYRKLYAEWLRNRAGRTKPVASKTQKKRPLRRWKSAAKGSPRHRGNQ